MFAHVKAIECLLRTNTRLPVNVKCMFEGEEEIGSPHLQSFVTANRTLLHADVAVMSDMPIAGPGQPAITYALRGSLGLELEVSGPRRDLHSGLFGGAVHNPPQALCEIITSLHDRQGRIAIKNVYDNVVPLTSDERSYLSRVSPSDSSFLRDAQAERAWGERGYSVSERTTIRPALTINGISGGYQGVGGKGIIPARAAAKLSFRLVPNQDPYQVERLFRDHIARVTPNTVRAEVRAISWAKPALMEVRHPAIRAAAEAYKAGFGSSPVYLRCGGTIPVVNMFLESMRLPTVLMGFALPNDQMHGPNERFSLVNFYNGIRTSASFLKMVGFSSVVNSPDAASR
jgi:acetylornithine deacetylase/succinyl-diaminopimelate desuccinylase-like protein